MSGSRFQGFQKLKARGEANDTDIPARMAVSPVFSKSESFAFGRNIAQVHIRTDLFAAGLSFLRCGRGARLHLHRREASAQPL
jgi:hypothetical protein